MRFQNGSKNDITVGGNVPLSSEEAESQPLLASKLKGRTAQSRNDNAVNNYGIGTSYYSDNNLNGENDRRSRYCIRILMISIFVIFGATFVRSFNSF